MGPRKPLRNRTYSNLMASSLINLILYNSSNHSSRQSLSIAAVAADLVTYIFNYGSAPPQTGTGLATARDQIQLGLNLRDGPHVAGHHSAQETPEQLLAVCRQWTPMH